MSLHEEDRYVIIEQKYIEDEGRYAYESIGYFRNGTVAQKFLISHKHNPFSIFYICDVAFASDFKKRSLRINFSDGKGNAKVPDTQGMILLNSWFNDQESDVDLLYTAYSARVSEKLRRKAVCRCLKSMLHYIAEFNKEMLDALDYLEEYCETNECLQIRLRMEEIYSHKHGNVFVNNLANAIIYLCEGSFGYAIACASNVHDASHFQSIIRDTIGTNNFLSSL